MDEWEQSFVTKSERRRSRSRRRRFLRRVSIIALVCIAILAGLWVADMATTFMKSAGGKSSPSIRHR
jgi:hypothetical protein